MNSAIFRIFPGSVPQQPPMKAARVSGKEALFLSPEGAVPPLDEPIVSPAFGFLPDWANVNNKGGGRSIGGLICPAKYHAYPRGLSARHRRLGDDEAAMLGGFSALAVLKCVLSRCLKRYKAIQTCENFSMLGVMAKRPISRGNRERAWRDSNSRPAA